MAHPKDLTSWQDWTPYLSGGEDENLAEVLAHVRLDSPSAEKRAEWANDWQTRMFCDLGLHLLYVRHLQGNIAGRIATDEKLFAGLGAANLVKHASRVVDPRLAMHLNVDRFNNTWGRPGGRRGTKADRDNGYIKDLVRYLFRMAPYVRRLHEMRPLMLDMARRMPLGEFIRRAAAAEMKSAADDPLVALQTHFQAALPQHPAVRTYSKRTYGVLAIWAELYMDVFSLYGLELQEERDWLDIAKMFGTVAEGAIFEARVTGAVSTTSDGQDPLSACIIAMLPSLLTIAREDIEGHQPIRPATSCKD